MKKKGGVGNTERIAGTSNAAWATVGMHSPCPLLSTGESKQAPKYRGSQALGRRQANCCEDDDGGVATSGKEIPRSQLRAKDPDLVSVGSELSKV